MSAYSVILGLGAGFGLAWSAYQTPEKSANVVLQAGWWVLSGALIGGRAAYVAVNWLYFRSNLLEIPQVWLGGFSGLGALAGVLLSVLVCQFFIANTLKYMDALTPLLATLSLVGIWGIPLTDELGNRASHWLVPFIGTILTLGWFIPLDVWGRLRLRIPGLAASLGLIAVSLTLLILSFLRSDPIPQWLGLRLDTSVSAAIAFISILLLLSTRLFSYSSNTP